MSLYSNVEKELKDIQLNATFYTLFGNTRVECVKLSDTAYKAKLGESWVERKVVPEFGPCYVPNTGAKPKGYKPVNGHSTTWPYGELE